MKRFVLFICVVISIVGCSTDEYDDGLSYESIHQTTLMYFMGTNLKSYYNSNISDMKTAVAAGALGSQGALFYLYPESSSVSVLYRVVQSGTLSETIEMCRYEDFSAYDEGALSMVLDDVKSIVDYTPDEVLNLIVGSHGYGWRLSSTESSARSLYEVENIWTRYLGVSSDGYMDIEDLRSEIGDTRFGYILFDACLMSSIEVLYRLRDVCDYVVASPCEVLTAGFPYTAVIPELFENDGCDYDLEGVCQAYYDFYSSYTAPYGAVAMCVMSELDALAESVRSLELKSLTTTELKSVQYYDSFSTHLFYDLGDMVDTAYVSGDYDAFVAQLDRTFPESCRLHTTRFLSILGGYSTITLNSYSGVSTSQMSANSYAEGWSEEPWAVAIGADN